MSKKKEPPPQAPNPDRLDERAAHVRDNIWYVPQEYLDALANSRMPAFGEQLWSGVYPWGGHWGWGTQRSAYRWGVMGVELRGLAGELLVVSGEWKERDAHLRRQEEAEEIERRIDSPWNVERAAILARTTIADFKQMPAYEKRRRLLEAFFEALD